MTPQKITIILTVVILIQMIQKLRMTHRQIPKILQEKKDLIRQATPRTMVLQIQIPKVRMIHHPTLPKLLMILAQKQKVLLTHRDKFPVIRLQRRPNTHSQHNQEIVSHG